MSTQVENVATYALDGAHTEIVFRTKHLGITTVSGRFRSFEGTVEMDPDDPTSLVADVTIDSASIDTNDADRDTHLRSADFFDVERYPHLTFKSREVRQVSDDRYKVIGDLTIRGKSREVELDVEFAGQAVDPWGGERVAFTARTNINRKEWGLTWNQILETGGLLVSESVTIELAVQAVKAEAVEA